MPLEQESYNPAKGSTGTKAEKPYPMVSGDPDGTQAQQDKYLIAVAVERFKQVEEQTSKIRAEALEDVLFINGQQWLESIIKDRADDRRPALTVNRLPAFVNQVVNDMRKNRPAIKIRPTQDEYKDNADVVDGLIRSIMTNGDAKTALDTAALYQVVNGFGYVRILTDYYDEDSFDQIIKISRIENPFAVYFPIHLIQELDYSDAPYCFIRSKMSKEDFYRRYPNFETSNYEEQGSGDPNWIGKDYVYVAEYFDCKYVNKTLYLLSDGTKTNDKPDKDAKDSNGQPITILKEREVETKKITWYLLTQYDVLDRKEIVSKYIPVVPVLGQEIISPAADNGNKTYISMIRFAKDPQRMFNYFYSTMAETIALAPRAPWVAAEGQIEDYKSDWQTANMKNHAVLVYKPISLDGNPVPPPIRTQPADAGASVMAGIQMATENLKAVTGIHDASLGANGNETSGRAIIARQQEGDNANYHFMSNQQIAIHHIGRILVDMIPKIYDTARVIRILGEDMTDKIVEINQTSKNGEMYDMSIGEFEIMVDVGPTYQTKRTETAETLINVLQAMPQVGGVISDILMRTLDFPMSDEAADRLKRLIQNTNPGVIVDKQLQPGQKLSDEEVQDVIMDLQKLMQTHQQTVAENMQLAQMIHDLQTQVKDKVLGHQVDLQKTIIKAEAEVEKANMNNQHDFIQHAIDHTVDLHKFGRSMANKQQPAPQPGLRIQQAQPAQSFQVQPTQLGQLGNSIQGQ